MNVFQILAEMFRKYKGILYNGIFIIYSWLYGLLLKNTIVSSASRKLFQPEAGGTDVLFIAIVAAAQVLEIIGLTFVIRRIRYIKTHPDKFPNIVNPKGTAYEPESIFLLIIALVGCRIFFAIFIGIMLGIAAGDDSKLWQALGAIVICVKDIVLFSILVKRMNKPLEKSPSRLSPFLSGTLLSVAGLIHASVGYDTFIERARNVFCTFSHWLGFGKFLLTLIAIQFFVMVLFMPTRIGYYFEEIEFADTKQDYRRLGLTFAATLFLATIPWLI